MTARPSSPGSPQPRRGGEPTRRGDLKPDITGADPLAVLKGLAQETSVTEQISMISRQALAQVLATIDSFNEMVQLPAIYPHLVEGMQREIDRQRAL